MDEDAGEALPRPRLDSANASLPHSESMAKSHKHLRWNSCDRMAMKHVAGVMRVMTAFLAFNSACLASIRAPHRTRAETPKPRRLAREIKPAMSASIGPRKNVSSNCDACQFLHAPETSALRGPIRSVPQPHCDAPGLTTNAAKRSKLQIIRSRDLQFSLALN